MIERKKRSPMPLLKWQRALGTVRPQAPKTIWKKRKKKGASKAMSKCLRDPPRATDSRLCVQMLSDLDADDDSNNGKDNEREEEADPSLFTRRARRIDRSLGVAQPGEEHSVSRPPLDAMQEGYPASVSSFAPIAPFSMAWTVSSCSATRMLI